MQVEFDIVRRIVKILIIILFAVFLFPTHNGFSQTVGVVLSGGGAKGYAHVGVLKALEEYGIPIDYITGTSMGAIVGGLYAAGYSPDEMMEIFRGDRFNNYYKGDIPLKYRSYFMLDEPNASLFTLKLRKKKDKISISWPTNMIATQPMDFGLIQLFAQSNAYAHSNFDSLYIPFRCIASDVYNNREKVFNSGDLGMAIRASMTFPGLFKPVDIDGNLYYDGGIYNNFPVETMKQVFHPDVIIGIYVSTTSSSERPEDDDLFGQIETLVIGEQDSVILENGKGYLLELKFSDVGVMDFHKLDAVSNAGYECCKMNIDSILSIISRRVDLDERNRIRNDYKSKLPDLVFDKINIDGRVSPNEKIYIQNSLNDIQNKKRINRGEHLDYDQLESEYYKIISNYQIDMATPTALFNDSTNMFDVSLKIKKESRFGASVGAGISSGTSSYAYLGATYKILNRASVLLKANGYIGRLYSSAQIAARIDVPTAVPLAIEVTANVNRLDYFKGSSKVFSINFQPPYIVDFSNNYRVDVSTPATRQSIVKAGYAVGTQKYQYFQLSNFKQTDTADITNFKYSTFHLTYDYNTLNHVMYPSYGTRFVTSLRYVNGMETNTPGSTTALADIFSESHSWFHADVEVDTYRRISRHFSIGVYGRVLISNKPLFRNYSSSILSAYDFSPITNSKTIYISNYRANNFAAVGLKPIIMFTRRFNLRLEAFYYMPYQKILKEEIVENVYTPAYSEKFSYWHMMGSAALVYNSRIGPVAISANYLNDEKINWYFMFHIGFLLFNKDGMDY